MVCSTHKFATWPNFSFSANYRGRSKMGQKWYLIWTYQLKELLLSFQKIVKLLKLGHQNWSYGRSKINMIINFILIVSRCLRTTSLHFWGTRLVTSLLTWTSKPHPPTPLTHTPTPHTLTASWRSTKDSLLCYTVVSKNGLPRAVWETSLSAW